VWFCPENLDRADVRYQSSAGIGKEAADLAFGYLQKKGEISSKL
jgi:hypothetical protein